MCIRVMVSESSEASGRPLPSWAVAWVSRVTGPSAAMPSMAPRSNSSSPSDREASSGRFSATRLRTSPTMRALPLGESSSPFTSSRLMGPFASRFSVRGTPRAMLPKSSLAPGEKAFAILVIPSVVALSSFSWTSSIRSPISGRPTQLPLRVALTPEFRSLKARRSTFRSFT